jgi:large subunit ribosomal protein L4
MAVVNVYDQTRKEIGTLELAPEVFEVPVRPELLHLAVRAYLAEGRAGTHKAKEKGEVSGGGKKPWRQKGTGRARSGSNRSPVWKGGGATFGPRPRSYAFKLNKKIKRLALRMALSSRLMEDNLLVVKSIDLPEIKTKLFAEVVGALGLRKALIVSKNPDKNLVLSARNYPWVKLVDADNVSVYDVLRFPQVVMLEAAAQDVQERLMVEKAK